MNKDNSQLLAAPNVAISVKNLGKKYHLYESPKHRLKEALHPFRRKYHRDFWALNDVSFEIKKGECLGIIGRNGSGKSTLLQILCGVLQKTTGDVVVNGRVSALLELGAGFNPELTGRENVYLNGSIMGFTREEMDERIQAIIKFADIGEFVDQPVKTYSSGMFVRLAFAAAVHVDPDILFIDEALSVGDIFFQQKCHVRVEEMQQRGITIILVSHELRAIEKYCSKVILLDQGERLFFGQPNHAVHLYYALIDNSFRRPDTQVAESTNNVVALIAGYETDVVQDWPSENAFLNLHDAVIIGQEDIAKCTGVALCDEHGRPCRVWQIGEKAYFYFEIELLKDIEVPIGGVSIINNMNIIVHAKGSHHYLAKAPRVAKRGSRIRFRQTMKLQLAVGEYTFVIGFATMKARDYDLAAEMTGAQLHSKINSILRVRDIGEIVVREKSHGLSIPFYGYVDLEGDSICELLQKENLT